MEGYRKCIIRTTLLSFDIAFRTAQAFTVFYREGLIFNISAPEPLRSDRTCYEGIDKTSEMLETDVPYQGSYLKNGEVLHGNYRPLIALPLYYKEFEIVHPLYNRYLRESEIKSLLNESNCDVKIVSLKRYIPNRLSNWLAAQVYYSLNGYWKGKEDYGFWHNMNEWETEPYDLEANQKICDMFHYRPRVPYNPLPEGYPNRRFV